MTIRKSSIPTKEHALAVCAQLFLEQGYKETKIRQILDQAGISNSSFQNFFRNKEGVLIELARIVFGGQFEAARINTNDSNEDLPPIYTYALETAVQLAVVEQSEALREIYTEAYAQPETAEYIYENTAKELYEIFGDRFPDYDEHDFYEMDIGSSGLMRNYMAKPCTIHFPLHRKVERFLTSALRIYRVSEDEIKQVLDFINGIDLENAASQLIQKLFTMLELRFDQHFSLTTTTKIAK